jgi:hypothetical protein
MKREEASLELEVLAAVGRVPDVALYKNETGQGFTGALERELLARLGPGLTPRQQATLLAVLNRHRIRWGLGEGSPDLVGGVGGRFAGIELKSATGTLEESQRRWHGAARGRGLAVMRCRSVAEVKAAIERVRKGDLE